MTEPNNISALFDQLLGSNRFDVTDEQRCQQCGEFLTVCDGVNKCIDCGITFSNFIDRGAEWRNDTNTGQDNNRVGIPVNNLLPETSYSIGVSFANCRHKKNIYNEIKKAIIWSQPSRERSLKDKFDNITNKCQNHAVPKALIEFTQTIYNDLKEELEKTDEKQKRGDNDQGLQAAALYYAFQEDGHPKNYKDIANIFEIDQDRVSDGMKLFKDLMDGSQEKKYKLRSNTYSDYIDDFCERLHITGEIKARVVNVANKSHELGILDSNTPSAIVTGCIYYVIIENGISHINKKGISSCCKVSVPTITKVCDKLFLYTVELSQ